MSGSARYGRKRSDPSRRRRSRRRRPSMSLRMMMARARMADESNKKMEKRCSTHTPRAQSLSLSLSSFFLLIRPFSARYPFHLLSLSFPLSPIFTLGHTTSSRESFTSVLFLPSFLQPFFSSLPTNPRWPSLIDPPFSTLIETTYRSRLEPGKLLLPCSSPKVCASAPPPSHTNIYIYKSERVMS